MSERVKRENFHNYPFMTTVIIIGDGDTAVDNVFERAGEKLRWPFGGGSGIGTKSARRRHQSFLPGAPDCLVDGGTKGGKARRRRCRIICSVAVDQFGPFARRSFSSVFLVCRHRVFRPKIPFLNAVRTSSFYWSSHP